MSGDQLLAIVWGIASIVAIFIIARSQGGKRGSRMGEYYQKQMRSQGKTTIEETIKPKER